MKLSLKRDVGLLAAILYGIGIILGAGVYALVGEAAGMAGNSLWLSFLIASLVSAFTGLSYMELVSMFPKSAAEYTYVKNAFNNRLLAFNVGWVETFADMIAATAVSLGFAGYFHVLFGAPIIPVALGLLAVLSFINFWGIGESSKINVVFSLVEIVGLIFVILLALFYGNYGSVNYLEMPNGIGGTLSAAALIFFAYIGFEDLANISEEVKDARRNVPKALMISVIVTSLIYVLVGISVVSLVDWRDLAASKAPLAFAVSSVLGEQAFTIMSIIALFATANTVLIALIVVSRHMYGMSRDGSMPKALSTIHRKRRTPWVSILVTMIFAMLFVLFGDIGIVASITDFGTFYIFIFVNAAAIMLRYRMPNRKRLFRTPLNIGRFPLIPFFGLLSSLLLVSHLHLDAILIGSGFILAGAVVYLIYKKS